MREAAPVKIIEGLLAQGAQISAYDPEAAEEARKVFDSRIRVTGNNYDFVEGADALVLATEWQAFRNPNFEQMKRLMRTPVVFDGRNIYDPARMRQLGFTYYAVGKPWDGNKLRITAVRSRNPRYLVLFNGDGAAQNPLTALSFVVADQKLSID